MQQPAGYLSSSRYRPSPDSLSHNLRNQPLARPFFLSRRGTLSSDRHQKKKAHVLLFSPPPHSPLACTAPRVRASVRGVKGKESSVAVRRRNTPMRRDNRSAEAPDAGSGPRQREALGRSGRGHGPGRSVVGWWMDGEQETTGRAVTHHLPTGVMAKSKRPSHDGVRLGDRAYDGS